MRVVLERLIVIIIVLVLLGFFTLLERKILGLGQVRIGPNKGIVVGLAQPLLDGFKLFMKGSKSLIEGGLINFYFLPIGGLVVILIVWVVLGVIWGVSRVSNSIIVLVLVSSLLIYFFYLRGLFRKREYRVFGSLRASAQFLSYEGIILLCLINIFILIGGYSEVGGCYL